MPSDFFIIILLFKIVLSDGLSLILSHIYMCCLPLCRSTGTGAGDMLFGHWFPPHVAMSMVLIMAHSDIQRCRGAFSCYK